jgi:ankyrin repeat protein
MSVVNDQDVIEAVGGLPDATRLAEMLDAGGNPNAKLGGRTALDFAVGYKYLDKVKILLAHGADPNIPEDPDPNAEGRSVTPLINAVRHDNQKELVEVLLKGGADPNQTDDLGMTPLMSAATFGATENARLLVQYGADAGRTTEVGQDALYFAMSRDRPDMVGFLLGCGLNPTVLPRGGGLSALQKAQNRNLVGTVALLKEKGFI